MKQVITTEKRPIKLWLNDMEEGALEQAKDLANLPFAFKHIAIMPDSHRGYGMPIGGVLAAKKAIIPNAVGVDIGCGMSVVKTEIQHMDRDDLKDVMGIIRETVPTGFDAHDEQQDFHWMPEIKEDRLYEGIIAQIENQEKALYQLGTLGGGNHFIEIQQDLEGFAWIMIHSGSRNLGYTVAQHYDKLAKEMNELWYSDVPPQLAFFPLGTKEYKDYLAEMNYCIEFALNNRKLMMERSKNAFREVFGESVSFTNFLNKPHNFAAWENHYNTNVIVHRKGATRARKGELGMIPGSQGSPSYIVKGKGKRESFESCSHGAGRLMSRTKARKTLSVEKETARLDDFGVLHAIRDESDLDEAPGSYKDIIGVMGNQEDLVDIEVSLRPLGVIKG